MKNTRAALRYAKAALNLSLEQMKEEAVAKNMQEIIAVFEANKELSVFLENPVVANQAKQDALIKVFSALQPISNQLIALLTNNNRIDLLPQVATAYLSLFKKHQGKETAVVTTAVALTPDLEKIILAKAKEMSSAQISLENKIDPSIMGGFILRIGDMQYNASVAHQLEQLKRELTQTNYSAEIKNYVSNQTRLSFSNLKRPTSRNGYFFFFRRSGNSIGSWRWNRPCIWTI